MPLKTLPAFALLFLFSLNANAEGLKGVGMKKLDVIDPVAQHTMDTVAFFPSTEPTGLTRIGTYLINASRSASIRESRYLSEV